MLNKNTIQKRNRKVNLLQHVLVNNTIGLYAINYHYD